MCKQILIKKFEMEKEIATLMAINVKLYHDPESKPVHAKYYRSAIGNLLYFTISWPNIFLVGMCTRFQSCLKAFHLSLSREFWDILRMLLMLDYGTLGLEHLNYLGILAPTT